MKTSHLKTALLGLFAGIGLASSAQSGELRGLIKSSDLQPVPFATIRIYQGNQLMGGTQTDMDGRYKLKPLTPGIYELVISEPGHQTQPVNKIKIIPNEPTYVDVKLTANTFSTITIMAKPLDYTRTGVDITMFNQISMDAEELNRNGGYTKGDVKGSLELMTSDVINTGDGQVHFRGSRGDATGYFVDGVRILSPGMIPGLCIENVSIFPGGVPAMYGDLSSGVVMITTRSYFSGIREKNVRLAARKERIEEERAEKKAKEDEEKRAKEIEEEKAKEREKMLNPQGQSN